MALRFPKFSNLNINVRRFTFGFGQTDNAFITVKNGNQIIEYLNALGSTTSAIKNHYFSVSDPGGVPVVMAAISGAVCPDCSSCCPEPPGNCTNNCPGCYGINTSNFYKCNALPFPSTNKVAPGVYEITITDTNGIGYTNTVLSVKSIDAGTPEVIASVTKTGLNTWTVKTYNTATSALEDKLDKAVIEIVTIL